MIAYVVNQYPWASHTFIRREIAALEAQGAIVSRYALRGWDKPLADPLDRSEREKTCFVLREGAVALLLATLRLLAKRPVAFSRAAASSLALMRGSDRSVARHLITLCEASFLAERFLATNVAHIHAHFGTNSAEVAMLASILSGLKFSFTVHGPEEFDKPQSIHLRRKVAAADFVVAISAYCASQLYRWSRVEDWRKIKIIRCGVEQTLLAAPLTPPPTAPKLICVARFSAQKGHLLLLEAAARVIRAGHSLDLVFAGDGEMRPEIEQAIARLDLSAAVRLAGWLDGDAIRDEMLASRALVLASFAEGLPVVLMEAMALGRPVLTTRIAAVAELVEDGQSGWLFNAGSIEDAERAILACLAATPATLAAMGAKARAAVVERHDVDEEARKLLGLFHDSDATQRASRPALEEPRASVAMTGRSLGETVR